MLPLLPNPYDGDDMIGGKGTATSKDMISIGEFYDGTLRESKKRRRKRSKRLTSKTKSKGKTRSKGKRRGTKSKRKTRSKGKRRSTKAKTVTKRRRKRRTISNTTPVPGFFSKLMNRVRSRVFRKKSI